MSCIHSLQKSALILALLPLIGSIALANSKSRQPQEAPNQATSRPQVLSIQVGKAPHQIAFSSDGKTAFIAASGSNQIVRVDTQTKKVSSKLAVELTPLGVAALSDKQLIVTQFQGKNVLILDMTGKTTSTIEVGAKPSLFAGPFANGRYLMSLEGDNSFAVIDTNKWVMEKRFATGKRPFPGAATTDGRKVFIPNYDDGTVTVVDLWNNGTLATVQVGARPSGATMMPGNIEIAVAVRGENAIKFINTASHRVTRTITEGIGKEPFSVVLSQDGKRAYVNNAGDATVSVIDLKTYKVIGSQKVGEIPIAMAVTPDGKELWVSCEGSHEVRVLNCPLFPIEPIIPRVRPKTPTQVAVLGMIHGTHRKSTLWGLKQVEATIRKFKPDVILCEIPPDRWDRIWADFSERGAFEDLRIRPFPEYTDVVLPLKKELGFAIEPCAAWNREMNLQRRMKMRQFRNDRNKQEENKSYETENAAVTKKHLENPIVSDDPRVIHSALYDQRTKEELAPYDRYMNDYIGAGGWTNINQGHYDLIAKAIDAHPGKRLLITFGAGHKYWFLEKLRERKDIELIDVLPYLPKAKTDKD